MRYSVVILGVVAGTLLWSSCGQKEASEISVLRHKRDSLHEVRKELNKQIEALDIKIAALDTNRSFTPVTVTPLVQDHFAHYFKVHGVVKSEQTTTVGAEMMGTIKRIVVNEGDRINAGQTLAILDTDVMVKSLEELKTAFGLADTIYRKQKNLWDKGIGSQLQFLEAKNRKESLSRKIATLQEQISKAGIVAPYSGVVDEIFPRVGEVAGPGVPFSRLVNVDQVYISADVSENYIGKIQKGDTVDVLFNATGDSLRFPVSYIGQYINPNNRTFKLRIDVKAHKNIVKPNMLVMIRINDFSADSALMVQENIITEDAAGRSYIFRVVKGAEAPVAKRIPVDVVASYEGVSMISGALAKGDLCIVKGCKFVKDGEPVEIAR